MRFAVLALAALLSACASSSAIVTGTARPPLTPDQVRLYDAPPPVFEVIGLVQAQANDGVLDQWNTNLAMAELKERAARLGANGLIIDAAGGQSSGSVQLGPSPTIAVKARAIYVPPTP